MSDSLLQPGLALDGPASDTEEPEGVSMAIPLDSDPP